MKNDSDLIQDPNLEELKANDYDTNRGNADPEGRFLSNNRTGDMQGVALLDEGAGRLTSSAFKGKEEEALSKSITVHKDKNFRVIEDAQKIKEIEMRKARDEEKKEVEALLNLPQAAVPHSWDYLILPRKINVQRVPPPPTIMKEDYFEPVKAMVSN